MRQLNAPATKAGYGKAGKQRPLSNFPTATTTTKYIQLWDTDSRGKVTWRHKVDHAANHLAIVPSAEFTPDIAEHIIDSVKVFMTRLMEGIPDGNKQP